ncbi:MAG: hypothetical protein DRP93_06990 [Candidatus Neomarinimicrobiota bacterium]|nr:MAG: hypothetical protein DRP93_06990 [Candidatus Neomarinimicrobiota bacterium]
MKKLIPKIVITIAAMILWFLIVSSQTYVGVVDLPLKVYEPRANMTLGQVLPHSIKVRVEGPGRALYFERWSNKSSLILDVGNISGNEKISLKNYFQERPNQVMLQSEMKFLEVVYPDSINVMIDNKVEKIVPVKIQSKITLRPGFILVNAPELSKVTLIGPRTLLHNYDQLQTAIINKDNADISFISTIPIVNPDPELLTISPEKIDVEFNIEMIGERTISNIPIQVKNKPSDLEIQFIPNTVSLRVTGGNDQIQDLTRRDFYVYFDYLSQWFPNKNYYPVKITTPKEVLDVIQINPQQIEVVVIKKNTKE